MLELDLIHTVAFGGLVLLIYAVGVWLGEGASVSSVRYPYHVLGQYWALVPAWPR